MRHDTIVGPQGADLIGHPAMRAWAAVMAGATVPTSITVLQDKVKSSVFRLDGMQPARRAVIVKRCPRAEAAVELELYENVLPRIPISALRYYGHLLDDDSCWLLMEDAGNVPLSLENEVHRALASRWLAVMHTSAALLPAAARLPERGPARYLERLRLGRERIRSAYHNPALSADERAVLDAVVTLCDVLESCWHRVEEATSLLPTTLVHGDFRPKNARIRTTAHGDELVAIDWETAGWGSPATDLATAREYPINLIDVDLYVSMVRAHWPGIGHRALLQSIQVGRIFRQIAAIRWATTKLTTSWPHHAAASMRVYHANIVQAMDEAGLT